MNEETMNLIWGAEEIAKIIGRSTRATFHILDSGELPARKVGGRWVVERSQLIRFFMENVA
ncbi:helix-turn-helix domain-containing protein [Phyllobacterium calauticae]|jgi:Helix-turn-helix domain|uniref:helix-turn-helix domain-containing protein n=1 Tax=Phyllobacterium calauticae TaxID=2817027 RepID=UPI001CBF0556|nr:helix-turn-helix domain-containing protein [Phyllobacterium calauticae]MBZ3693411.1 helix-turn-helix domain-containing protein [Phyllobacterium calauticae]